LPPPEDGPPTGGGGEGPLRQLIDDNFLQYASYVIRDRAIPDIEDGLKPVQRRILWSLHENDDGKFVKVANIAGYCMQYHPHGNVSIEDALVALVNRGFLVEGQGNFGNIYTGDPAAASRYIECRLTGLSRDHLFNDALTPTVPSYDGRRQEPVHLPAKLPLLLMLGAEGIAVGLSTRILPHNVREVLDAQIAVLKKKPFALLPDFQQGGTMDAAEYEVGNGKIRVRAVIEPVKQRQALVIRELPFSTTTDTLIASIEDAARKKKIKIRSIDDFTAEQVEIVVSVSPGEDLEKTVHALYAFTHCEMSISARAVVIQDQRPVETDVDAILRYQTKRLVALLKKELEFNRKRLLEELHNKTLAQLFVEHRIYKLIEQVETYKGVQEAVLNGVRPFREQLRRDITLPDVERLLAIPIKRISLFDIQKNRKEIGQIIADLDEVEQHLENLTAYAVNFLRSLLKRLGDDNPRRTRIESFESVERRELVAGEYRLRWDKDKGYIGHDISGDELFACSSYDKILLLWRDGRYKVLPPPEKLFVDRDLLLAKPFERDEEFFAVFTRDDHVTYMKRCTLGGAIMNREYSCTLPGSTLLLLTADTPKDIYVRYKPAKGQRIHQQVFHTNSIPVKGVKARGHQITVKRVAAVHTEKPRGWDRRKTGPRGVVIS
jgi:topoisomerase-4 subunit A